MLIDAYGSAYQFAVWSSCWVLAFWSAYHLADMILL
jgi:hypothetical protein